MEAATVTKGEFARICNVSPGRVSQWLSEGKIGREALEGQGRAARIRVSVAQAQLNRSLDISQRMGNGLETRIVPPAPKVIALPSQPTADAPPLDTVEERIKAEKLREASFRNRKLEEEERARRGIYVLADDAEAAQNKALARMLMLVEGGLPEIAAEMASKFQVPQRDVLHLLRLQMRKVRAAASGQLADEAAGLPELIEQDDHPVTGAS